MPSFVVSTDLIAATSEEKRINLLAPLPLAAVAWTLEDIPRIFDMWQHPRFLKDGSMKSEGQHGETQKFTDQGYLWLFLVPVDLVLWMQNGYQHV